MQPASIITLAVRYLPGMIRVLNTGSVLADLSSEESFPLNLSPTYHTECLPNITCRVIPRSGESRLPQIIPRVYYISNVTDTVNVVVCCCVCTH